MGYGLPSHDIIRGYHSNVFQKAKRKKHSKKIILEQLVDPAQQLKTMQESKANLVPAEILYKHGFWETKAMVYQHRSEEIISCCSSTKQVEMSFIAQESKHKLHEAGYPLIHIGLILIGIHSLHRNDYGSKVMVALVDSSDNIPDKATIGSMEVDMSKGVEICYLAPNMLISVRDFCKFFKLIIKTK